MDQKKVIESLYRWIKENKSFGQCKCDHVTEEAESIGLYLGPKEAGHGRSMQIAQADIVVFDESKVKLIIEVDPSNNPKKILGAIFSAIIADNYTPSYRLYDNTIKIENTVILYVTNIEKKGNGQKEQNIISINNVLNDIIENKKFGLKISNAAVCYGNNDEDTIKNVKSILKEKFRI